MTRHRCAVHGPQCPCMDCGVNTNHIAGLAEVYMINNELWNAAVPEGEGILCIGCLEARLGRTLTRRDFQEGFGPHDGASARLLNRLTRP